MLASFYSPFGRSSLTNNLHAFPLMVLKAVLNTIYSLFCEDNSGKLTCRHRLSSRPIVLADLKSKRDQIDQAIQAIESVRGGASQAAPSAPLPRTPDASLGDGAFHGLSIAEATKKLLASGRRI